MSPVTTLHDHVARRSPTDRPPATACSCLPGCAHARSRCASPSARGPVIRSHTALRQRAGVCHPRRVGVARALWSAAHLDLPARHLPRPHRHGSLPPAGLSSTSERLHSSCGCLGVLLQRAACHADRRNVRHQRRRRCDQAPFTPHAVSRRAYRRGDRFRASVAAVWAASTATRRRRCCDEERRPAR